MKTPIRILMVSLGLFMTIVSIYSQNFVQLTSNQPPELKVRVLPDLTYTGEAIQLGIPEMVSGGSGDYIFFWSPAEGLDDPNSIRPWANPIENTDYTLSISDGNSCTAMSAQSVVIDLSDINEFNSHPVVQVYPVPSKDVLNINISHLRGIDCLKLSIFHISGRLVKENMVQKCSENLKLSIGLDEMKPGSYIMVLTSSDFSSKHKILVY